MKRAKDTHPLVQKLDRLFETMDKEGLSIVWNDCCFVVRDKSGECWELRDLEYPDVDTDAPCELPPICVYKIVRD